MAVAGVWSWWRRWMTEDGSKDDGSNCGIFYYFNPAFHLFLFLFFFFLFVLCWHGFLLISSFKFFIITIFGVPDIERIHMSQPQGSFSVCIHADMHTFVCTCACLCIFVMHFCPGTMTSHPESINSLTDIYDIHNIEHRTEPVCHYGISGQLILPQR